MKGLEETSRIAFAGDWHGNYRYAHAAMHYAALNDAQVILHVGDFGVWKPYKFLDGINKSAEQLGLTVLFVDGNHEQHHWLNVQPVDEDGVRRLRERVWHLPRGFWWEFSGVRFLALGGAHSVDRQYRRRDVDWFAEEHLSIADLHRASQAREVDVIVSHDAPNDVEIPGITSIVDYSTAPPFPPEDLVQSELHRSLVGQVVDELSPRYLVHGHYHIRYGGFRQSIRGFATRVEGLDCDGSSFHDNILVTDISDIQR